MVKTKDDLKYGAPQKLLMAMVVDKKEFTGNVMKTIRYKMEFDPPLPSMNPHVKGFGVPENVENAYKMSLKLVKFMESEGYVVESVDNPKE